MEHPMKTRSQRRVEKRQAAVLLALVLLVTLISFALGVWVGRRGGESDTVVEEAVAPPPATPAAVAPPLPEAAAATASAPAQASAPATTPKAAEAPKESAALTFYNRLPEGEAPLGSGINSSSAQAKPAAAPASAPAAVPAPAPAPESVAKPAPPAPAAAKTVEKAPAAPAGSPTGGYAVQVGAFPERKDADKLRLQLMQKGYPCFVVEADVNGKRWYRVRVGPYDKSGANNAVQVLKSREGMKGFVARM